MTHSKHIPSVMSSLDETYKFIFDRFSEILWTSVSQGSERPLMS